MICELPDGWKEVNLTEVCETNNLSYSNSENWSYANYLDTGNITDNRIDTIQFFDLKSEKLPSRAKRKVAKRDIVYSTVRPNQRHYGIIKEPLENMLVSTGFTTIRTKTGKSIPEFVYYYLTQDDIVESLHTIAEQSVSAYPSIKASDFENLNLFLPSLKEQQAIANTLSCLDDKIELNNKMNKTLEEMAQALFKHWFIDFEFPNKNGNPYKSSAGEMVESELGLIPANWNVGTISDLGQIVGGGTPSKLKDEYYTKRGTPWVTPKDLSIKKSKFISKGTIDITDIGLKNSSAKIMPQGTILFSSRAPIGYIAIAKNDITTNQGFKSIVPINNIGTEYIYYYIKYIIDVIEGYATGSTFKEISGTAMCNIPALVPDNNMIKEFITYCLSIFNKQQILEDENQTLQTLRDTLLPKLMSGEIRVPL